MKFYLIVFIGIILCFETQAAIDRSCIQKGENGNCEFYQCFEKQRQCGSSGYLTGYGYKYCNKFRTHYNKFTQAGKKWIDCVRPCLTKKLVGKYQESIGAGQQCKELKTYAFDTHVRCYLDCGFCSIVVSNAKALSEVYDTKDMLTSDALKQIKDVMFGCIGKFLF